MDLWYVWHFFLVKVVTLGNYKAGGGLFSAHINKNLQDHTYKSSRAAFKKAINIQLSIFALKN
jgi:hypothetical protein